MLKLDTEKYKNFCPNIKMQNLSQKELKLIVKKRNICGYKSMPKDKLLRIINNNEGDRQSLLKSKKSETKSSL